MRVGFFCRYVPFELILACGGEPLQMQLRGPELRGDASYFPVPFCATAKFFVDWLQSTGRDSLDVVVFAGSCDAARRLYEVSQRLFADKIPLFLLEVPHHVDKMTLARFAENLRLLAFSLGNLSGITPLAVAERLLEITLSSLKWRSRWSELFFKGSVYGDTLRKLNFLDLPFADAPPGVRTGIPILLSGGHIFIQEVTTLLEESGFLVFEDSPYAMRKVLSEDLRKLDVAAERDPFLALSELYLRSLLPCPRVNDLRRLDMLKKVITSLGILGIVYFYPKFCDFSLYELPLLKKELSLPLLAIDYDTSQEEAPRWRIRIEAFYESLSGHAWKRPAS
ncbi:2-hydroxyacyl-CoA dehydratase family protein [Thermatribacter velox]|uniref:2-hydroxyacyl-CoA dehydratase family protein n=1 Tax=Thermatribacter velox TaxID=3039681 RepID=A0ABZ2YAN4_9BACT